MQNALHTIKKIKTKKTKIIIEVSQPTAEYPWIPTFDEITIYITPMMIKIFCLFQQVPTYVCKII